MFKLNPNKTEAHVIANKHQLAKIRNATLHAEDNIVNYTSSARNIGVVFDATLSMILQIRKCFFFQTQTKFVLYIAS